jgi:hypothetical protein
MVRHLTERAAACPQQKYALGGHSQGGFVTTGAIDRVSTNILNRIVAVTMFGAPACPTRVRGKCISYCQAVREIRSFMKVDAKDAQGDTICENRRRSVDFNGGNLNRRQIDCARYLSLPTSGLGTGGHLGYNADGTYVRAAACYIASKLSGA